MSTRFRNNIFAALIVFAFWCVSFAAMAADPIITETTSTVTSNGTQETTVKSPPPSAISPNFGGSNSDLCTISSSGAMGTQVLSLSVGATYTEENCLLLKKARMLYSAGMKVASVSLLCSDPDIWEAMMMAGSPCPIDGLIGDEAKAAWQVRTDKIPMPEEENEITAQEKRDKALSIMGSVAAAFLFF
jgi:hypothetical protein|tara:strand:- start:1105 stop:1668 length:564 start_codon:yes stop_codon:yes gene_type:complete